MRSPLSPGDGMGVLCTVTAASDTCCDSDEMLGEARGVGASRKLKPACCWRALGDRDLRGSLEGTGGLDTPPPREMRGTRGIDAPTGVTDAAAIAADGDGDAREIGCADPVAAAAGLAGFTGGFDDGEVAAAGAEFIDGLAGSFATAGRVAVGFSAPLVGRDGAAGRGEADVGVA